MRKIIIILIIVFIAIAIACNKKNTIIVNGKITNPIDEPTGLSINYFDRIDTIVVDTDGTFFAEIILDEEHLGWFGHGHYAIPLYLVPGANINLEFNAENSKGWRFIDAQITGEGSKASAFLYSLDLKLKKPLREELVKMKVDSFAAIMNNIEQNTSGDIENFIANNSPSDKFIERIKLKQKVELAIKYLNFTKYHQYSNSQDKPIPSFFQEYIDAIPLDDEENCKEISEYRYFLYQYHQDNIDKKMKASGLKRETVAYINQLADEIIALNAPQEIKDDIARWEFSVFYKRPDSLRQVYRARYGDVVKNQEYIDEFEKAVAILEKLKPGNIAPTFNYPDINGEMVASELFKGKVIYIDVWAIWCGPCIYEIPHLKKLEAELQDEHIVFVSISIDYDKDKGAWEKMVIEKELGGYQLYAKGVWESKIAKDYNIRGIPYFIIIDKEGKLVEVFATRPSDPKTKEKLLKLAK